ncbi:MAG: hypothetical protein ACKOXB_04380 [Flavobacteriales bacterium]
MKITTPSSLLLASALMLTLSYSCTKDREIDYEDLPEATNVESSDDNETSDEMYTHVYTVVHTEVSNVEDQAFKTGISSGATPDACANITYEVDSTNKLNKYLKKMTIDYGTTGCTWDGRVRKGKIIITKQGKIATPGTITTVTLEDFYIDGYRVEGTATLENKGFTSGKYSMKYDVVGGKVTAPDNTSSTWATSRTFDFYLSNGSFKIIMSGTCSGINHKGVAYSVTTTKDLLAEFGCKYIKSGTLVIKSTGKPDITVDYGDGECDNKATVIVNGTKYKKTL